MKSYLQLTQQEKQEFINYYYQNKEIKTIDICKKFDISKRCQKEIFKEFNINGRLKNRYTINENYFSSIDNHNKAYILGLLYADGYVGDEKTNNIILVQKNENLLLKIKEELNYTGEIKKGNKGSFENSKESFILNFSNLKIAKDLRNLGLFPNKSLKLNKLPNIKEEFKFSFLLGYFDGDGSITKYNHKFKKNNKEYSYIKGVMTIIATENMLLDIINTFDIKQYQITNSKTPEMKYIRINAKKELTRLYNEMYKNISFCNEDKMNIWNELMSAFKQKCLKQKGLIAGKI